MSIELQLRGNGSVGVGVSYEIFNPFPIWQAGRDPRLVQALMIGGVYGSYLRVYAPPQAKLRDVRINGASAGPEEVGIEVGRMSFGRFISVKPGARETVQFYYETPAVIERDEDGTYRYSLYIQKQPGTRGHPVQLSFAVPSDATAIAAELDGQPIAGSKIETDLVQDRAITVEFKVPNSRR
jgi:hypothetical protein